MHRIRPDFTPGKPPDQPSYLVVYRDRSDGVGFLEINAVTSRLLELLSGDEPLSGAEILGRIAEEMGHPNLEAVLQGGLLTLQDLKSRDVVLGTRTRS